MTRALLFSGNWEIPACVFFYLELNNKARPKKLKS